MIKRWFSTASASEFGIRLAQNYAREFALINSETNKSKREKKRNKLLASMLADAKDFNAANKLNIYKKAKLGNAIKWTLKDLGYDDKIIDSLLKEIFIALA